MNLVESQQVIIQCAKNVLAHAFGNAKYDSDVQAQYEFLMVVAKPELKDLINKVLRNRGIDI
jgi:hypothetical protein